MIFSWGYLLSAALIGGVAFALGSGASSAKDAGFMAVVGAVVGAVAYGFLLTITR